MLKKIKTQEETEKERQRNQVIIGVVLIVLLVFSSLGYAFLNTEEDQTKVNYRNFEFIRTEGLWQLEKNGELFYFQHLPHEIENVSISGFYLVNHYYSKPLYFVNSNPAVQEILINLEKYILRYQDVCLEGMNCSDSELDLNLPEKSCEDNVIIFEDINENIENNGVLETSVYQRIGCVYISGDYIKGADALLYKMLEVV